MKCSFVYPTPKAPPDKGAFPVGHVIDVRTATRFTRQNIIVLCQIGAAKPADAECAEAVKRTPAQLIDAQCSYGRVMKGIHPDDFKAFDEGQMVGYDKKGEPIPGPNVEEEELDIVENETEEEEYDDG